MICENNRRTTEHSKHHLIHLPLIAAVLGVALSLAACGGEKENLPGAQPAPSQTNPPPVKPSVTGTKLIAKVVTASATGTGGNPKLAVDEDVTTAWSAGDVAPPQWIQLDLGEPSTISQVLLNVGQTPEGPTNHQVFGGPSPDNLKLLGTLSENTYDGQWLALKITVTDVRYLKVVTTKTPSWVAWREIEVYK